MIWINLSDNKECCNTVITSSNLWDRRLGHLNRNGLEVLRLPYSKEKCARYIQGKLIRKPFYAQPKCWRQIDDLIHTDIAGPIIPATCEGEKYIFPSVSGRLLTFHSSQVIEIERWSSSEFDGPNIRLNIKLSDEHRCEIIMTIRVRYLCPRIEIIQNAVSI